MAFGYGVYFTERDKDRVVRWDPDGGSVRVIAGGPPGPDPSQRLVGPYGLAFDRDGMLLIADKLQHRICRLRQGRLETLSLKDVDGHRARRPDSPGWFHPGQLYCPTSLFLEKKGTILASFFEDQTLYRIHPDGRLELVLGVVNNRRYLLDTPREAVPPPEVATTPISGPTGVVARKDGTIFFIERSRQVVREYHPSRGLRSVFARGQAEPWSKRTEAPPRGRLDEYHPVSPVSLALGPDETLYLCDNLHGCVLRLDLAKRMFERVLVCPRTERSCLDGGPVALAFGPDGTAWVADSASQSIQAYRVGSTGSWQGTPSRLVEIGGTPLHFISGGMGLITGS